MSKIAISGKGGVGKTTITALLIRSLIEKKKTPILVVDADPNSNLYLNLGATFTKTVADLRDDVLESTPEGFSKTDYFNLRLQEIISENNGFDLLVMGRPEGPGCYCSVNNLLREYLSKLAKSYPFVIVDCEAGLEHLSRRTSDNLDTLILVTEPTISSLYAVRASLEIARKIKLKIKDMYLLLNKIKYNENEKIKKEIEKLRIPLLAEVPFKEELLLASEEAKNLLEIKIPPDLKEIFEKVLERIT
ncbi:MAG: AAA family ATPase [Candidatus Omnitrophica bacterium]|nr:AAA family ATPase [Candidatus Omnitrophota bacterium]